MLKTTQAILLVLFCTTAASSGKMAVAGDYKTIFVDPGKNVNVYWEVNLGGRVFVTPVVLKHARASGARRAKAWPTN